MICGLKGLCHKMDNLLLKAGNLFVRTSWWVFPASDERQGCWTRRQKNSTISSTSFSSSRKPSTSSCTSYNSPRKGSPRPSTWSSSPRHPLAVNEYSIPGHWIDGQNTEHRTLVLWRWRRWLQALGLFNKKNMPNNNTAYSIGKINLSFISFLWVEQWSGGADVDSTHALALATEVQGGGANLVDFNFERDWFRWEKNLIIVFICKHKCFYV